MFNKGEPVPGLHYLAPLQPGGNAVLSMVRRLLDGALNEKGLLHHEIDRSAKSIVLTAAELSPFFKNKLDRFDRFFSQAGRSEIQYFQLITPTDEIETSRLDIERMKKSGCYQAVALISVDRTNPKNELQSCMEILVGSETPWRIDDRVAAANIKDRPISQHDMLVIRNRHYVFNNGIFIDVSDRPMCLMP